MKRELPDYQKKQNILYLDAKSADEPIAYGDRCLEANRIFDALEFYQKAKHEPGLEEIRERAVSTGDAMLFEQTNRALRRDAAGEAWSRLGRQAFALKKYAFARHAFEKGGDSAMLEEIRKITVEEIKRLNDDKT